MNTSCESHGCGNVGGLLAGTSELLNRECFCRTLDPQLLRTTLSAELDAAGIAPQVTSDLARDMFAAQPVFAGAGQLRRMAKVVEAVEAVVALPAYREAVFASVPASARHPEDATRGVFYGYDFHLNGASLGLIEINTNAGGALLNAVLARAQRACCPEVVALTYGEHTANRLEAAVVNMFAREWTLAGKKAPLRSVAIVDERAQEQALYPEFLLVQRLLQRHGIRVLIANVSELQRRGNTLRAGGHPIDLVYNRCTDFYLQQPQSTVLVDAWHDNAVVLTPNPRHYALYADKRNLVRLCDADFLRGIGADDETVTTLTGAIPNSVLVGEGNREQLWAERRRWFFKPVTGFGSRAAYRGDKLTKRVWTEITAPANNRPDYIAQAIVQPGERLNVRAQNSGTLKFDLRNYCYDGEVQWVAARLYQGQCTNFRTAGGGFAPVYGLAEGASLGDE